MSARRFPWPTYWIALAVIVIIGGSPVAAIFSAEYLALANGCGLAEAMRSTCLGGGEWVSNLLGSLVMYGWMSILVVPAGIVAVLVWGMILFVHRSAWQRSRA